MTAKEAFATIRKNYPYQEFCLFRTLEKALTELEELKEKIRNLAGNHILSKIEEVFGENNSLVNKIDELLNLCKGSEEVKE